MSLSRRHVSPRAAAAELCARGLRPVPVRFRTKGGLPKDWPSFRANESELDQHFLHSQQNLGLLLDSQELVCLDLDSPEAVCAASILIPRPSAAYCRKGEHPTHILYRVRLGTAAVLSQNFMDPTPPARICSDTPLPEHGSLLLEILSDRQQVLVPPSIHPEGDEYRWLSQHDPEELSGAEIVRLAGEVGAAALLARHWPEGARHDASLSLAGGLLRAWGDLERVETFVKAVATAAGDTEVSDRILAVRSTQQKLKQGDHVTGWPSLAKLLGEPGDAIVRTLCEWLHIRFVPNIDNSPSPEKSWSPPLNQEAYYGLAGEITRAIEPHSEADPVAILAQLLIAFGNRIGGGAFFRVEETEHRTNEFGIFVGRSSKARKGTSWGHVEKLFEQADGSDSSSWLNSRVNTGMSTGEGLIWAVRDPIEKTERARGKKGEDLDPVTKIVDEGVLDKRLLVRESEFASVLKRLEIQGNTLSPVVRQAFDGGTLSSLTKNSPAKSTGAHISIIANITQQEFVRTLSETETANGFGNRFLIFLVKRSKELPEGGRPDPEQMKPLVNKLRSAICFAETVGEMHRDSEARELWCELYSELSRDRPGLAGEMLGRAEAHVLRLSMLYALLDKSSVIRSEHLLAAVAIWEYVENSAKQIFGDRFGNSITNRLLESIRAAGETGMTRTELSQVLQRHATAAQIEESLKELRLSGSAHMEVEKTAGRPVERWLVGPKRA